MRISVALCTFNGRPYVGELLQSIANQQRLPDELVVGDDGSTDGTLAVLDDFANAAPFAVRISKSSARRGVTGNFSETMLACNGDVIALCDQDDVWTPNKLTEIDTAFARPALGAVFSDADLVDADGSALGGTLWEALGFDSRAQALMRRGHGLDVLLKQNVVTGGTLAVSAQVAAVSLPLPPHGLHDVWLGWVAACVGPILPIPLPLVQYRQHGGNMVGAPRRRLRERLVHRLTLDDVSGDEAAHLGALLDRLHREDHPIDDARALAIEDKIAHLRLRSDLPRSRVARLRPLFREVRGRRYSKYGRGWQSVAFDLFFRSD